MIGLILVWKLDDENKAGKMVGITLGIVYAINMPIQLSQVTSNVAGFTKRSVVSALIFIAYCVGNLVGPQFFLDSEEPAYPVSFLSLVFGSRFELPVREVLLITSLNRPVSKRAWLVWSSVYSSLSCCTFIISGKTTDEISFTASLRRLQSMKSYAMSCRIRQIARFTVSGIFCEVGRFGV